MTLSRETEAAIEAFRAWTRAKERYDQSQDYSVPYLQSMRLAELDRADARLSEAVHSVPLSEFVNYVTLTSKWYCETGESSNGTQRPM